MWRRPGLPRSLGKSAGWVGPQRKNTVLVGRNLGSSNSGQTHGMSQCHAGMPCMGPRSTPGHAPVVHYVVLKTDEANKWSSDRLVAVITERDAARRVGSVRKSCLLLRAWSGCLVFTNGNQTSENRPHALPPRQLTSSLTASRLRSGALTTSSVASPRFDPSRAVPGCSAQPCYDVPAIGCTLERAHPGITGCVEDTISMSRNFGRHGRNTASTTTAPCS